MTAIPLRISHRRRPRATLHRRIGGAPGGAARIESSHAAEGAGRISTSRASESDPGRRTGARSNPMSAVTEAAVLDALRTVQEPELGGDLVTRNMIRDLVIDGAGRRVHDRADHAGLPAQGPDRGRGPPGADAGRRRGARDRPGARRSAAPRRAPPSSSCRASRTSSRSRPARAASARARCRVNLAVALAQAGRHGRPARRRHHRAQHPDDARARGPAARRATTTRSSRSSATA